ncbi:MAG: energy transducer TonB [Betaproteobacteria bacterium]|nr:energy transducer TonB [Betaproteobacteria bacterium]
MQYAATATVYSINTYPTGRRISVPGVAGIIAAHIAVAALLASLDTVPLPAPTTTLMAQIIPSAPPPVPESAPPRPKPAERAPAPQPKPAQPVQPQILAAQAEAPAAPAEIPALKEAPAPAPAPSPPAVSQPRFDAGYLQNPTPPYPALSRRLGEEGKVVLRVFVDPGGRPSQIEIRTGSGSPRLDQAAQEAVWRWKFIPARRGDEAIGAWVQVPIVFNLRG